MFTLVILYTLYTLIYHVKTHVYPINTGYPVYPLWTDVYPSNTTYPVYPYISSEPMFTLVLLYTLNTRMYGTKRAALQNGLKKGYKEL